jgi:hypothetical protein
MNKFKAYLDNLFKALNRCRKYEFCPSFREENKTCFNRFEASKYCGKYRELEYN